MGKVVEKKAKKKKGRPSLLEIQKRKLHEEQKQQELKKSKLLSKTSNHTPTRIHQQNPSSAAITPASVRRSGRQNAKHEADGDDDDEGASESAASDDDDGDPAPGEELSRKRKREKELKLVLKSPNSTSANSKCSNSGSESNAVDGKKRKIHAIWDGSEAKDEKAEEKRHVSAKNPANTHQDADTGPSTSMPLPDKKMLLFILDRLQKKDTFGVFAEPVDPEELPDYHEVIEHPMDFGTVRKKLNSRAYACLEDFERDVFLISSNAMQYNAQDTVYFRQARSIQELAKKDFEALRQDSDNEPETKIVRRGRPPTKNLKKAFIRCLQERVKSDSEGPLVNGGENSKKADHDHKKGSNIEKYGSTKSLRDACHNSRHVELQNSRLVDRYNRNDAMIGSASSSKAKHGKRQIIIDESRRNTYTQPDESAGRKEPSVLSVFDMDVKQMIPVGLHTEHGYTRSLARFAEKLGPVAWKVASSKIGRCLPNGVEFGRGWVGENDAAMQRPQPPCFISQILPPHHPSPLGDSSSAGRFSALEASGSRLEKPGGKGSLEQPMSYSRSNLEANANKPSLLSDPGSAPTSGVSPIVGNGSGVCSSQSMLEAILKKPSLLSDPGSASASAMSPIVGNGSGVFSSQSMLEGILKKPSLSYASGTASTPAVAPNVANSSAGPTQSRMPETFRGLQPHSGFYALNSSMGKAPFQSHQNYVVQSRVNGIGINGTYGLNPTIATRKLIEEGKFSVVNPQPHPHPHPQPQPQPQPMFAAVSTNKNNPSSAATEENNNNTNAVKLDNLSSRSSDDCLSPQQQPSLQKTTQQQRAGSAPPDLNIGCQSPSTSATARGESSQPDLALQL